MRKIYINGEFITLENNEIEAILIENEKIKNIGTKEEILKLKDKDTKIIDLEGKTMMPAFIDSHSHFFAVANNLLQVSLENCRTIKEIQNELLRYKNENNIEEGKWIIACGYDHNKLAEKRHITKTELDEIISNNPIVIHHKSGHNGVLNSKGLEWLNITKETIPPFGGKIEKIDNELTGYLEENAFIEVVKKIPMASLEDLVKLCDKAQKKYASYGITTLQEGMMVKELIPIYKKLVEDKRLYLDVIAYMDKNAEKEIEENFKENIKNYKNNFKIGGVKIFLDGSPQSRTAWMRTPYINDEKYFGYGTMNNEMKFTFHQDAPVIEPNMFETIWCAVNRKTKNGKILGEEEKITVLEAIKAVTINAAYQYFEEDYKGSIKEGKLADLIIVDKNPLKVEKDDIRNIKVLETIKSGKTIMKAIL